MQYKDNLIIENERVILKSMNREDSERYRILRNREDNRKWFFTQTEIAKETQEKWFDRYCMDCDEYMFSIYEKFSERYLGAVAVYHIDRQNSRAEVGRIIVDRFVAGGKGYGKDAVQCIMEWGGANLGIKTFYAQIYNNNLASIKTFLRCGFAEKIQIMEGEVAGQIVVERRVEQGVRKGKLM